LSYAKNSGGPPQSDRSPLVNTHGIDSTPLSPRPPAAQIDAASRDIPTALADTPPLPNGKIQLVASLLAGKLQQKHAHNLAAAQWAIHDSIDAGRLAVERVSWGGVITDTSNREHKKEPTIETTLVPKPTSFDNFRVVATESLWQRSCSQCGQQLMPEDVQRGKCSACVTGRQKTLGWLGVAIACDDQYDNKVYGAGFDSHFPEWKRWRRRLVECYGRERSDSKLWEDWIGYVQEYLGLDEQNFLETLRADAESLLPPLPNASNSLGVVGVTNATPNNKGIDDVEQDKTPELDPIVREQEFDAAISGYAERAWEREVGLHNKAFRVRKGHQSNGELFGNDGEERGWYTARGGKKRVIRKNGKGVWVYLTESHNEKLKVFFSGFRL
jgi:hypothetical protein